MTKEELAEINHELLLTFGYEDGFRARYQIVYTTGIEELRTGLYCKFDDHGNEIASRVETKRVLKYPFNQDRYVLERLFYFKSDELPLASTIGSYEAVYYFETGERVPLPVTKDIAITICRILENPQVKKKSASEFKDEEEKEKQKQIERDYLYLEDKGRSALFYDGVGTFIDSTKQLKDENGGN